MRLKYKYRAVVMTLRHAHYWIGIERIIDETYTTKREKEKKVRRKWTQNDNRFGKEQKKKKHIIQNTTSNNGLQNYIDVCTGK